MAARTALMQRQIPSYMRLALAGLLACAVTAAWADVTPRQAIKAMQTAGYSGIGGVTRSQDFYYAAALTAKGKRVRVTVDANTGRVVNVGALPRGAGSVTPLPEPSTEGFNAPRITVPPVAQRNYYQPPPPTRRVGIPNYPYNSYRQPTPGYCRYTANGPGC